jgi:hypothetical protein
MIESGFQYSTSIVLEAPSHEHEHEHDCPTLLLLLLLLLWDGLLIWQHWSIRYNRNKRSQYSTYLQQALLLQQ